MSPTRRNHPLYLIIFVTLCFTIFYHRSPSKINDVSSIVECDEQCVEDIFNGTAKMQDDDPRLISHLKKYVLLPPVGTGKFVATRDPNSILGSSRLYPIVNKLLKNKTNGFFIECGANDGELISNTVPFELNQGWTGLLVEADPIAAKALKERGRNAWVAEACLSLEKYPVTVEMMRPHSNSILGGTKEILEKLHKGPTYTAHCYPLSSMLYALNVRVVDYLSLDIEGAELPVLKTIPWDKIGINVISVEAKGEKIDQLIKYLISVGYRFVQHIKGDSDSYLEDSFYVHRSFES